MKEDSGLARFIGKVEMSHRGGQISLAFKNPSGYNEALVLSEEETDRLFLFLQGARHINEMRKRRQEAIDRGETPVQVQRFEDENGEPRYRILGEGEEAQPGPNGMVEVLSTTRPADDTEFFARLDKAYGPYGGSEPHTQCAYASEVEFERQSREEEGE